MKVTVQEKRALVWESFTLLQKKLQGKLYDYFQLFKIRLSFLVVFTTVIGYLLAGNGSTSWLHLALVTLATFSVVCASNAFNQILERDFDALMERTANRPLPSGQMKVSEALVSAITMTLNGLAILWTVANWKTALLATSALLLYVLAYTPLKRKTEFCTLVGAVSGAIPPVMGWVAVRNELNTEAFLLFAVQFIWQFPHFWSIAWIHRDDYRRVGFYVLPCGGDKTVVGRQTFYYTVSVVLISFYPLIATTNFIHLLVTLILGGWLLIASFRFKAHTTKANAKKLLMTCDIYLTLLLSLWLAFS